jgi:uncharacterized membrane protein YcaP (DUF421 family)
MENVFLERPNYLLKMVLVGLVVYVILIFYLRISGKRSLSKWNSYDFIITIALGSTFASVLTGKEMTIAAGAASIGFLIFTQYLLTWIAVRSDSFEKMIKGSATILFKDGEFIEEKMKKARVPRTEVESAARSNGFGDLSLVAAVVLETDGTFSVIGNDNKGEGRLISDD